LKFITKKDFSTAMKDLKTRAEHYIQLKGDYFE